MLVVRAGAALVLGALIAGTPAFAAPARTAASATSTAEPPVRYTVRRGDTLFGLAARGFVRPSDWQIVAQQNRIADPHRLPVGRTLVIPASVLRRQPLTASVAAFSGQVTTRPGDAVRIGAVVAQGHVVSTGANSFVTLALVDGSRVTLPSQSQLRIERLQRIVLDGHIERRFVVEAGRADFGVTPREKTGDRFLVRTPVAVAAVRGTEFRVAHETAGGNSVVSVIEGEVASRPQQRAGETAITAGNGHVVGAAAARTAVLLPPPVLERPGRVQDDPVMQFEIAPGPGVRRRLQLARDAGFVDLFAEAETTGQTASFDGVGNGSFFVRLTAIDADGVEGLPANYAVDRFLAGLEASAGTPPGKPRRTQFRWQASGTGTRHYDFVLARDEALTDRVVDTLGLTISETSVTGLSPGEWYWQVTMRTEDAGKLRVRTLPVRKLTIAKPER